LGGHGYDPVPVGTPEREAADSVASEKTNRLHRAEAVR